MSSPNSYAAKFRIKKQSDFSRLKLDGKKYYSGSVSIVTAKAIGTESRLGIIVSKKVHKGAVERNKIKRRIREIFRLNRMRIIGAWDIIIIARPIAVTATYEQLEKQILGTLNKIGLMGKRNASNKIPS